MFFCRALFFRYPMAVNWNEKNEKKGGLHNRRPPFFGNNQVEMVSTYMLILLLHQILLASDDIETSRQVLQTYARTEHSAVNGVGILVSRRHG